jgi:hypothetical protein
MDLFPEVCQWNYWYNPSFTKNMIEYPVYKIGQTNRILVNLIDSSKDDRSLWLFKQRIFRCPTVKIFQVLLLEEEGKIGIDRDNLDNKYIFGTIMCEDPQQINCRETCLCKSAVKLREFLSGIVEGRNGFFKLLPKLKRPNDPTVAEKLIDSLEKWATHGPDSDSE